MGRDQRMGRMCVVEGGDRDMKDSGFLVPVSGGGARNKGMDSVAGYTKAECELIAGARERCAAVEIPFRVEGLPTRRRRRGRQIGSGAMR